MITFLRDSLWFVKNNKTIISPFHISFSVFKEDELAECTTYIITDWKKHDISPEAKKEHLYDFGRDQKMIGARKQIVQKV